MDTMTVYAQEKPIYDLVFAKDYSHLKTALQSIDLEGRKICIVTDSHVKPYYFNEVSDIYKQLCKKVTCFSFTAGEKHKNLATVQKLYEHLIKHEFDRKDYLVALGGGVVGDLTGFAAATYLRGVNFIQMPTTLLSQVDSSIGGKTGVDFDAYKNMVGAFHMPELVYINIATLKTLDQRQFSAGMGEVVKHGIIKDKAYFNWLQTHKEAIISQDLDVLLEMVKVSCSIKKKVVENDPHEQGERALLNYGHTLGHAIEKYKNFKMVHGECVALGAIAAAHLSFMKGLITEDVVGQIISCYESFALKTSIALKPEDIKSIVTLVKHDKKMDKGQIKFILIHAIGDAFIDKTITQKDMTRAITLITE